MAVWRQRLNDATQAERKEILDALTNTERLFLQEIVHGMCAIAPLGLVDCSHLKATCRLRGWRRLRGRIHIECICRANAPGAAQTYRWRLRDVRPSRRRSESASN